MRLYIISIPETCNNVKYCHVIIITLFYWNPLLDY